MTGLDPVLTCPFPQGNLYLQYVALKDPLVYSVLAGSYTLFLFTHSVLHLFNCPLGSLRLELSPEAETKDESLAAVSRSRVRATNCFWSWGDSSPDQNYSRQQLLNG